MGEFDYNAQILSVNDVFWFYDFKDLHTMPSVNFLKC